MAILKGFPPSNTISPSVRITEKDLSFVAPEQTFHRAGLVGFASKGPINVPTTVRTQRQLNTIFGFPHPDVGDPYLIYAAMQYLTVANELTVVRVAEDDAVNDEAASTAEVEVPAAGGQVEILSATTQPYSFSKDSFFRWRLNGILAAKTLVILADANRAGSKAGFAYTCAELVSDLNDQLDSDIDGIEFYCGGTLTDTIGVRTTFSYGPDASLELVSVQDAAYGGTVGADNVTGLGTEMTAGSNTTDADRYPTDGYQVSGTWDFTGLTGTALDLQVVVDGTDNVLIDNAVQTVDLSSLAGTSVLTSEVVTAINDEIDAGNVPGGFEAVAVGNNIKLQTLHKGRDARILVKSTSNGFAIFDFDGLTGTGVSPSGTTGDSDIETLGIVAGSANDDDDITFTITADSAGIEGNNTSITITNDIREGSFRIDVFIGTSQVETWGQLTKDTSSSFYIETFLALYSDYIRAVDDTSVTAPPADTGVSSGSTVTLDLSGGTDGIPADPDDQDELLIGNSLSFTGLQAISEPDQIDLDLVAVPGHASTSVVAALLELCQNRADCLGIVDPPFGLTVNEIIAWQNGAHTLNSTRFDSDFGALYWPWLKMRDTHNRVDVWVPPSGTVMATIARSDFLAEPWFAPAGINRGVVFGISDVFSRPSLSERDEMYGNRNAINPIIQFADTDGFLIWGQKTLQRRPTALDRVNVRRLMFVIEKRIRAASRTLLFDPHDEEFRRKFIDISTAILREVQVGRGITAFIIKADEELNTPDVIDRNEFRARIGIQPTRAAEFMFLEFSIHRTGDFGETADTFG